MSKQIACIIAGVICVVGGSSTALLLLRNSKRTIREPSMRIADSRQMFSRQGWIEIVPVVVPPTTVDQRVHIRTWLRLPTGSTFQFVRTATNFASMFPDGTELAREEMVSPNTQYERTFDIRAMRIHDHRSPTVWVLRPEVLPASISLVGFEWETDNPQQSQRATSELLSHVERTLHHRPGTQRILDRLRGQNDCLGCHRANREMATSAHDAVHRATDSSGLFSLRAVFESESPIENYRPRDNNDIQYTSFYCGNTVLPELPPSRVCPDGGVIMARYNLTEALMARAPHAVAVCASRRSLIARMDSASQNFFTNELRICDPSP